ncbi:MAG TPA: RsmE family RNA methyltransferase [Chloroflexota bacterium]
MADRGPRPGVTLHRFFLPPDAVQAESVTFPSEASRQIERVLRLKPGERVVVLDGSGMESVVVLETVGRTTTGSVEMTRRNEAEPATYLTLYQGLLKGAKMELVLQKCTEVGVSRIVPVVTARAVPAEPSSSRQGRFEIIAREAAEQSGRGQIPEISPPMRFSDAIVEACNSGPAVFFWEEERSLRMKDLCVTHETPTVSLFIGPEGGFTEDEAEEARHAGCNIVTLGSRILRAETAAIVGTTLLLAKYGDL